MGIKPYAKGRYEWGDTAYGGAIEIALWAVCTTGRISPPWPESTPIERCELVSNNTQSLCRGVTSGVYKATFPQTPLTVRDEGNTSETQTYLRLPRGVCLEALASCLPSTVAARAFEVG